MINIRREQPADYAAVYELVKQAFEHAEHTDHDEHNLVNRLRQSPFYLPELALVAETGGIIVGHIMFTETGSEIPGSCFWRRCPFCRNTKIAASAAP